MKKTKFLTLLATIAMLLASCTSETEMPEATKGVTKIMLSLDSSAASSRMATTKVGDVLKSEWEVGDELAAIHSNGSDLIKLTFSEYANGDKTKAYFTAATPLLANNSYALFYPYNALIEHTSAENAYELDFNHQQSSDDIGLKNEILASDLKEISPEGYMPSFVLKHFYTMVHLNVTVNNNTNSTQYVRTATVKSRNNVQMIVKSLYFVKGSYFNQESSLKGNRMGCVMMNQDACRISAGETKTFDFWLAAIMTKESVGAYADISIGWENSYKGDITTTSNEADYATQIPVMGAGVYYPMKFSLDINAGTPTFKRTE